MATYGMLNCKFPVLKGNYHFVNSDFGNRTYTNYKGKEVSDFHKGIDVQGKNKVDDIVCPFAGKVVDCRNDMSGTASSGADAKGNFVTVDCGSGVQLRFLHLKKGSVTVKKGDTVKAGQIIGYMGLTGNTSGYHLHFDIAINGNYVDPKPYLAGTKALPVQTEPATGNYIVTSDDGANVRLGPGTNFFKVSYSQFTVNAKAQVKKLDKKCPDYFPKGVKLTLKQFKRADNGKWWGKCPSGWVCVNLLEKI